MAAYILRARSANRTHIDCYLLFEPYEMDRSEFDPTDAAKFWHRVNRQDWAICERVHQGMRARVHHQGIFSPMEDWNLDIRRYVTDRIGSFIDQA